MGRGEMGAEVVVNIVNPPLSLAQATVVAGKLLVQHSVVSSVAALVLAEQKVWKSVGLFAREVRGKLWLQVQAVPRGGNRKRCVAAQD